jgi:curved DNA-binding protein CbpA
MRENVDYYVVLQVSANADPDMIQRVYRLLAQRYHPDNQETGNEKRFREIHEAYTVLSDPDSRTRYDVMHQRQLKDRFRVVSAAAGAESDFEIERVTRLTVLEALYTRRRLEPREAGLTVLDLESMLGRPREHLEFTVWFLGAKKYVSRDDNSRLIITADGAEYLEQNYDANLQRKRLKAAND